MVKIKKDAQGLYAQIDGWICRPITKEMAAKEGYPNDWTKGTKFKEGDKVRGTHPAGPLAYLRVGKKGAPDYRMEIWAIIDMAPEFKKAFEAPESPEATTAHNKNAAESLEKLKKDVGVE